MDARKFDSFTRAVSWPRRAVVGGLFGLALAPMTASAKRKKHKKKKRHTSTCPAPGIACGTNCCSSRQQCEGGQCQDPGLCGTFNCAGFTNPVMQGGTCACRATTSGPTLCFAQQECGGLSPCNANGECSDGYACMAQSCGGKPTCVRTCI